MNMIRKTYPNYYISLCIFSLMLGTINCSSQEEKVIQALDSQQLLVVKTPHWDAVEGLLIRYEGDGNNWKQTGAGIPINVGKNGMYWGKGLENFGMDHPEMSKREGDGRSPAGIFPLISAFGYAHPDSLKGLGFPYEHVDAFTQCIEDTGSAFYNQIIDAQETPSDWTSADHMLRKDDLYEWGVLVGHNYGKSRQAGDGSCIFLHAWRKAGSGTAGCTAMEKKQMREIVFWLDAAKKPFLVQAPEGEYAQLKMKFHLP